MKNYHHQDDFGWEGSAKKPASSFKRCYETHPPLPLGGGLSIYGGSCGHSVVPDADIYVGLDMSHAKSLKAFPWESGESFLFYIPDMGVPASPEQFIKLIDWLCVQLTAQKKVHVGCIGGHGRTGMVLSAVVAKLMGKKDAIEYVRENYCKKAVESAGQVAFLVKHFGVNSVLGAKEFEVHHAPRATGHKVSQISKAEPSVIPIASRQSLPSGTYEATPMKTPHALWGANFSIDK